MRRQLRTWHAHSPDAHSLDFVAQGVSSLASEGVVLEVGLGHVAKRVAEMHGMAAVTVIPKRFEAAYHWAVRHLSASSRPIVCVQDDLATFIADITSNPQV